MFVVFTRTAVYILPFVSMSPISISHVDKSYSSRFPLPVPGQRLKAYSPSSSVKVQKKTHLSNMYDLRKQPVVSTLRSRLRSTQLGGRFFSRLYIQL